MAAGRTGSRGYVVTQPGPSLHQSALLLHAMTASDRDWLLARLDQSDRERLQVLLDELESLGIPADESILHQALASVHGEDGHDADQQRQTPVFDHTDSDAVMERMLTAGPEQLAAVLKAEPDLLIARFLGTHPWPWREEVLARLGPVKGRGIRKHMELLSLRAGGDVEPRSGGHNAMDRMLLSLVRDQLEERRESLQASEPSHYRDHGLGRGHRLSSVNKFIVRFLKPRRA